MDSAAFYLRLQQQGLSSKLYKHENTLCLLIEPKNSLSQESLVSLVCQTLASFSVNISDPIYIYGRSRGHFLPDWVQVIRSSSPRNFIHSNLSSLYGEANQYFAGLSHRQKCIYLPSPGQKLNPNYYQLLDSEL